jgi:hypothetical protein
MSKIIEVQNELKEKLLKDFEELKSKLTSISSPPPPI